MQSKPQGGFNPDALNALNSEYPNGLSYQLEPFNAPNADEQRLDLDDLADAGQNSENRNFFVCSICTMVVKDAKECSGCNAEFCKECVDPWIAKHNTCPRKCRREEPVDFVPMHRYARQELELLKFKCRQCNSVHPHNEALKHKATCPQKLQPCPQGCGMGLLGKDLEYHFKLQCANSKLTCEVCEEPVYPNRQTEAPHDCIKTLKEVAKQLRERNGALELQLQNKKEEEKGQEDQQQPNHHPDPGMALIMQRHQELQREVMNGGIGQQQQMQQNIAPVSQQQRSQELDELVNAFGRSIAQ